MSIITTMQEKSARDITLNVISRRDYWRGFTDDTGYIRKPTTQEKQRMLQYPPIRSAVKIIALPLLAASLNIKGDETQDKFLRAWFAHHYRACASLMLQKGISWGYSVAEKVYQPAMIDGRNYLMLTNIIAPQPLACEYKFDEMLQITGFTYEEVFVEREKTALYIYQGDEVCLPYGVSICDDVFWTWLQVMEDWSRWGIYKDFKAIPPMKLEYPEDIRTDAGGTTDLNEAKAEERLKKLRTLAGITLPKRYNKVSQAWETLWNLTEIQITEKTGAFIDSINKLESMLFIGALIPKRIIEQDLQVGAYAMLKEQAEFFYHILQARLEEWEEYLRRWFIDPMLQMNFGSVKVEVNLDFGDELMTWYLDLISKMATLGYATPDMDEIMSRANIPHIAEKPEERVETEATSLAREPKTQADILRAKRRIATEWADEQNKKLLPLKEKTYDTIADGLRKVEGVMGLRIERLMKNKWTIRDLEMAVQIPRNIFGNMYDMLQNAFDIGNNLVYHKGKIKPPESVDTNAKMDLRLLASKFEGSDLIGGQPELLEERLFYAVMSSARQFGGTAVADTKQVVDAFVAAFENYIKVTLPDNVLNELNIACQMGVKYAVKDVARQRLIGLKET